MTRRGFTLIEILVVLTIIGLLMGVVALGVVKYSESGRISDARARLAALEAQIESYRDRTGSLPAGRLAALGVRDANPLNEGIEALVAALRDKDYGGRRPDDRWLGNTDDDASTELGAFDGSDALLELLDPWDNPFVYIAAADYTEAADYVIGDGDVGDVQSVRAQVNPVTGVFFHFGRYQLRSAGPDGELGTQDDLANYEIPLDDA